MIYERMLRYVVGDLTVRVWVKMADALDLAWNDVDRRLAKFIDDHTRLPAVLDRTVSLALEISEAFATDISAVEVLWRSGNGQIIYTEWP